MDLTLTDHESYQLYSKLTQDVSSSTNTKLNAVLDTILAKISNQYEPAECCICHGSFRQPPRFQRPVCYNPFCVAKYLSQVEIAQVAPKEKKKDLNEDQSLFCEGGKCDPFAHRH